MIFSQKKGYRRSGRQESRLFAEIEAELEVRVDQRHGQIVGLQRRSAAEPQHQAVLGVRRAEAHLEAVGALALGPGKMENKRHRVSDQRIVRLLSRRRAARPTGRHRDAETPLHRCRRRRRRQLVDWSSQLG